MRERKDVWEHPMSPHQCCKGKWDEKWDEKKQNNKRGRQRPRSPNAPLRTNSSYVPATDPSSVSEPHFGNWISITLVTPLARAGTPTEIQPCIWKPLSYRTAKAVEFICVGWQLWPGLLLWLRVITFAMMAVILTSFPKAVLKKERKGGRREEGLFWHLHFQGKSFTVV